MKRVVDAVDIIEIGLFLFAVSGATYIFSLERPVSKGFLNIVKELYLMGADRIGTGVISAILGLPLETLLGSVGAKITILILILLAVMLFTGWTPVDLFNIVKWPFIKLYQLGIRMYDIYMERKIRRFKEETSLENMRSKPDFPAKTKKIDIPLDDKKMYDIPLDGEGVAFAPEKEKRINARTEKLPNIDVDLGPDFDPSQEGVELNPTGPAGSVVKEVFEKNSIEREEEGKIFQSFDSTGNSQSISELQTAAERMRKANERLKMADSSGNAAVQTSVQGTAEQPRKTNSEVDELAKKADTEYLKNVNAPTAAIKQKRARKYHYPPISYLTPQRNKDDKSLELELSRTADHLVEVLQSFGVNTKVVDISRGPTVTRYELQPESGVRLSRIVQLADDIAMNLAATSIRIEAPIPGKAAVGIEVPNKQSQIVRLRSIIESEEFQTSKGALIFAIGQDISGAFRVGDIEKMPHLLIAGATGMGKSVCINSILVSLLYKYSPDQLRMILVDPKMVEFGAYNGLPHLYVPVVTDPRKAAGALGWAVSEMLKRYRAFSTTGNRNITEYNNWIDKKLNDPYYIPQDGERLEKLPRVIIVIDELADLMQVAANEVEDAIARLAAMARAAGMYLILATQRPSVDVITGVIKNNIPSRIAFAVSSQVDSRTILDGAGAEKLLGRGDMLYMPVGVTKPVRIQGSLVDQEEVDRVVSYIKNNNSSEYDDQIISDIERLSAKEKGKGGSSSDSSDGESDVDEMFEEAVNVVLEQGGASTSMLQRKLRLGYARAARIIDEMEDAGIIGPSEGSKPRQILITKQQWLERVTSKGD
ncbi:MAG: DNA translocase FtsK [Oscillospiraceae bacterium]|nr:DNA translocase FtsK [Oscillospiraceae bacterium]MBR0452216.1 DNA translocase FtsK [Oscillospiraceae bacterium]